MFRTTLSWVPVVLLLASAGTAPTLAASKADTRLDGTWQIDPNASDDFDSRLQAMAERMRARRGSRRSTAGSDGPGRGADRGGADGAADYGLIPGGNEELPPESRDELRDRLGETFRPPQRLRIETVGDEIVMRGDAPPERRFRLLETVTRMDVSGTSTISTRWSGAALQVDSRYTNRSRSQWRYAVDRTGAVLNVTLQYADGGGGKLELHSLYRRIP